MALLVCRPRRGHSRQAKCSTSVHQALTEATRPPTFCRPLSVPPPPPPLSDVVQPLVLHVLMTLLAYGLRPVWTGHSVGVLHAVSEQEAAVLFMTYLRNSWRRSEVNLHCDITVFVVHHSGTEGQIGTMFQVWLVTERRRVRPIPPHGAV